MKRFDVRNYSSCQRIRRFHTTSNRFYSLPNSYTICPTFSSVLDDKARNVNARSR